ncbi:putative structural maintenance of chromosomes protein fused with sulphatase-modifying factor [Vibrio nigripulchritudo SOn1]|uniref:Structural maintenance of chromosomes protein fused with sulphatase-modifying factor n=1 Tax=Vibrio nigripulchritudo SOn1 TaxID=1238450 RepID=A0AAV2VLR5_9VIBR|nr:formylglycine-generating enzyme family protein [Vibrio nigripulchritudo]CCO45590.1 putative structural maintenance of chromosomes protein fused with sulphatase-modifying factor [Vibrio nigripulchritudo SOn1]
MRQGLPALLLALSPSLIPFSATAESLDIASISEAISSKKAEIQSTVSQQTDIQATIRRLNAELDQAEKEASTLENTRVKAKQALERQYAQMLEDPDLDLSSSQKAYQDAWARLKQNQQNQLDIQHDIQEQRIKLSSTKAEGVKLDAELLGLEDSHYRLRAQRLQGELTRQTSQTVSYVHNCAQDATLAQCKEQSTGLALQKAVNLFQSALIDNTTENDLVKQHVQQATLNIHVVNHQPVRTGFIDGGQFQAKLEVAVESRPSQNAACRLLDIDSAYCFDPSEKQEMSSPQKEVRWVTLTVRSNQYDDRVLINGVSYGTTPVDIMLPTGAHTVSVVKDGFRSFNRDMTLRQDGTLRAVLVEKANVPRSGKAFADQLSANQSAPQMVVVGAGKYFIGKGGEQQVNLAKAYSISATPITVKQFATFVNDTGYKTSAEKNQTCSTMENSVELSVKGNFWRQPGFKQSDMSPVVCLSRKDAQAYTKWLSQKTGYQYRLPTEQEWEIAARAGSSASYWWGNEFGSGKANTGWGGTKWSNTSSSPVNTFRPNALGLYDMVGNVWEWTGSRFGSAKGGAWSFAPAKAAAHETLEVSPNATTNYIGFRIVRLLDKS